MAQNKNESEPSNTIEEVTPVTEATWRHFREYGHAPIDLAALLSLNINPTRTIKSTLKASHPEQHAAFLKRCKVIDKNYGHHPHVPAVKHKDRIERKFGEVVNLLQLCAFASEKELVGSAAMIGRLGGKAPGKSEAQHAIKDQSPAAEPEFDAVDVALTRLPQGAVYFDDIKSKGARYTLLELGALAILLEEVLRNEPTKHQYLRKGRLSASAVGRRVEEIFKLHKVETFDGAVHQPSTIARHVGSAKDHCQANGTAATGKSSSRRH